MRAVTHTRSEPRGANRLGTLIRHSSVRYLLAGGISFIIDFGLLWLLRDIVRAPLWLATAAAFLLSFAFTYAAQKLFSFRSGSRHTSSLIKYVALVGINTIATVGIVQVAVSIGLGWPLGKVGATALTTIWNYFAYRYVVFVDRPFARRSDASSVTSLQQRADQSGSAKSTSEENPNV